MSDELNFKNGVRQGDISSGILFNFYLNEAITDVSKLPAVCTLNLYADNLGLVAQKDKTIQILLNAFTSKLYILSLQVNV